MVLGLAEGLGDGPKDLAVVREGIAKAAEEAAASSFVDGKNKKANKEQQRSRRLDWPLDYRKLDFTTQAAIVPNVFPFPDCHGSDCLGTLV